MNDVLAFYMLPKKAGVLAAMHLYAQGCHAFGLWKTNIRLVIAIRFTLTRMMASPRCHRGSGLGLLAVVLQPGIRIAERVIVGIARYCA